MRRSLAAILLLLSPWPAMAAQPGDFYHPDMGDFRGNDGPDWAETEIKIPPYPKKDDLLSFYVGGGSRNSFFVDKTSIAIGDDGVIRYIVIIRSPSGVDNVFFEGMRCVTHESRRYAFGNDNGSWELLAGKEWKSPAGDSLNPYRSVLMDGVFCPRGIPVSSVELAIRRLKYGLDKTNLLYDN